MVRMLGRTPSPADATRRTRAITAAGASPAAKPSSAALRKAGHAYDPGRGRSGGGPIRRA